MSKQSSFMLSSVGEFSNLKNNPKFLKSRSFLSYSKESLSNENLTKIGISINGKSCNAVTRNKIRRWIKSAYRQADQKLIEKNYDVLIVLSKKCQIDKLSFNDVKKEFNFILSNI